MRKASFFLIFLNVLLALALIYGLLTTSLRVTGKKYSMYTAQEAESLYQSMLSSLENESLQGTVFQAADPDKKDSYHIQLYTLRLQNIDLVDAQAIDLQISPVQGDICVIQEKPSGGIAPFQTGDYTCILLTENEASAVREITITYYLWGHPFTEKYLFEPS